MSYDPTHDVFEFFGYDVPIREWDAADMAVLEDGSSLQPAGAVDEDPTPAGEEENDGH